jgi:cleavage and polyadenylation specificity factor subunit 2
VVRNNKLAASAAGEAKDVDQVEINGVDENHILTVEPLKNEEIPPHNSVFINELKLSDFKQTLMKNNIRSVLWRYFVVQQWNAGT